LPISSDLIQIGLELIGKGGQAMKVEEMIRSDLVTEARAYGWDVDRDDTDDDLRSIVKAGREGKRWTTAIAA
jgi:transketolase